MTLAAYRGGEKRGRIAGRALFMRDHWRGGDLAFDRVRGKRKGSSATSLRDVGKKEERGASSFLFSSAHTGKKKKKDRSSAHRPLPVSPETEGKGRGGGN